MKQAKAKVEECYLEMSLLRKKVEKLAFLPEATKHRDFTLKHFQLTIDVLPPTSQLLELYPTLKPWRGGLFGFMLPNEDKLTRTQRYRRNPPTYFVSEMQVNPLSKFSCGFGRHSKERGKILLASIKKSERLNLRSENAVRKERARLISDYHLESLGLGET